MTKSLGFLDRQEKKAIQVHKAPRVKPVYPVRRDPREILAQRDQSIFQITLRPL